MPAVAYQHPVSTAESDADSSAPPAPRRRPGAVLPSYPDVTGPFHFGAVAADDSGSFGAGVRSDTVGAERRRAAVCAREPGAAAAPGGAGKHGAAALHADEHFSSTAGEGERGTSVGAGQPVAAGGAGRWRGAAPDPDEHFGTADAAGQHLASTSDVVGKQGPGPVAAAAAAAAHIHKCFTSTDHCSKFHMFGRRIAGFQSANTGQCSSTEISAIHNGKILIHNGKLSLQW